MRNILFLFFFIVVLQMEVSGQSKLGLKFSPTIATNRVSLVDTLYDAEKAGSAVKFSVGLTYDHELSETYYFSTGLIFLPKYIGIEISDDPEGQGGTIPTEPVQEYRINYLQIPATLKLFTNEIQPDLRIFFQVGGALEIKVFSEAEEEEFTLIESFQPIDASILFGAGAEYRAGLNTILYVGFTYQRGMISSVREYDFDFQRNEGGIFIRNTLVSLDLGIKF